MPPNPLFATLAPLTALYLILSAIQDLRSRLIYSFPCCVLTAAWYGFILLAATRSPPAVLLIALLHLIPLRLMSQLKIWGAGDSQLWMLISALLFVALGEEASMIQLAFIEAVSLAVSLIISILAGLLEYRFKERKLTKHSDLALAVGFAFIGLACLEQMALQII